MVWRGGMLLFLMNGRERRGVYRGTKQLEPKDRDENEDGMFMWMWEISFIRKECLLGEYAT